MLKLTYHNDPSHGWLGISGDLLRAIIAPKKVSEEVSGYSYYHQQSDMFYLEEDCDATVALAPLREGGYDYEVVDAYSESCFVRRLNQLGRFPAALLDEER